MKQERDRQILPARRADEPAGRSLTDADLEQLANGGGGAVIKIIVPAGLSDEDLSQVAAGTDGPPGTIGEGNGVTSGKATPILF